MFQCYLDDSGTSGLPIVTLGGFFAHMSQWDRIEPALDAAMNAHGVGIFHAKEFHDTKPPFRGWPKIRKLSFTDEIFSAAHGAMAGVAIGVEKEGLKRGKQLQPKAFNRMSPMGVAFALIMSRILTHQSVASAVKQNGLSFLVEAGPNNGEIQDYFQRMAKMSVFEGVLRSVSFVPKEHSRAIQLADFLVFYARRQLRNQFRFKGKQMILPACPYLETMRKHGPVYTDIAAGAPRTTGAKMEIDIKNLSDFAALTKKRL
ncbi:hypothetical protein ABIB99_002022 [Bradyrhizobium sp. LA6.1]|uniref:DUF3800 domain-containing protein n=1 Tax=Bradyrhizobium sp. LA6.1 TaxID=3156378 RepID=UPI00339A2A72